MIKLVFFGTSEFAIPALEKLRESNYDILAVVTQPDKPAGRHLSPTPSPVKVWALEHGLRVLQPTYPPSPPPSKGRARQAWEGIKGGVELGQVDVAIVASYGKIIPKDVFGAPKHGMLNIHPSLLPKYRGPSPIHAAILNGDEETGVTIIKLDEELDHGPIVAQTKYEILNTKYYYGELHDKLARLGAKLLIKIFPDYLAGKIKPVPQDHSKATSTKIITKDDVRIDWSNPAKVIDRQIRAYELWPVAWTMLDTKRLKIFKAIKVGPSSTSPLSLSRPASPGLWRGEGARRAGEVEVPGTVKIQNKKLLIQCGRGILQLLELQLEDGKRMTAAEFIRGRPNLGGKQLG